MKSEQFLQNVLQLARDQSFDQLRVMLKHGLRQQREMVRPMLENLLTRGNMREVIVQVLSEDGGEDLLPLMMGIAQLERDREIFEKRLMQIANFSNPKALDLLDVLHERVTPKSENVWRRAYGKLRARYREYFNVKAFRIAKGEACKDIVAFMFKFPSKDYRAPLLEALNIDDLQKFNIARDALIRFQEPMLLRQIPQVLLSIQERLRKASALGDLSFVSKDGLPPGRLLLLRTLGSSPLTHWEVVGAEGLNGQLREPARDAKLLAKPFQLGPPIQERLCLYFQLILEQRGAEPPSAMALRDGLKVWQQSLRDAYYESIFRCSQLAKQLADQAFFKTLEASISQDDEISRVWMLAGQGSDEAILQLTRMLAKAKTNALKEAILKSMRELHFEVVDDQILLLARDAENHRLRRLALELIANHKDATTHLEQLLLHSPLVIKESVAQVVGNYKDDTFRPLLVGLLMRKSTDSFRLILLKALEGYEHFETGVAAAPFLLAPHTLPVRLAAVETLFKAGGPSRIKIMIETLEAERSKRHRDTILLAFLEALQKYPVEEEEETFLNARDFFENLLHDPEEPVRLATIGLLERFSWASDAREGWVGILQKALQSLVSKRSEEETERLRNLIATVSALFESERKHMALRSRLNNIMGGLSHHLRLERLQALKQLDWIFRPEMVAGDPEGVKRLVLRIENVMDRDEDDLLILESAIEIAGKIGHPVLRAKIREFLEHDEFSIVSCAEEALQNPVSQILLDAMIESVFHIDDSQYMTRTTHQILESEGYISDGANDPKEAIEKLQKREFDLLILDLNMPKMRGLDFLKYIRKLDIAPRFTFVLTSVRNREELIEVFKEGVDGILLKPFRGEDLVEKVAEVKARCS